MRTRRDEAGASAVEFALVVPFLAMLLIGVTTVGLAYSGKIALANAVREAARAGASMPAVPAIDWGNSVVTRLKATYADPGADELTICARLYKAGNSVPLATGVAGGGCASAPAQESGGITNGCYVNVWATKPASLNWVLGSADITMSAKSVAVYNRVTPC